MEMFGSWLLDVGPYHWLALAAVLIGLEMVMPTQYLIWPGIAAAVTGMLAFLIAMAWPAQLAIFAVLSVVLVVVSHYLPKQVTAPIAALNQRAGQLVGRLATVAEDFQNGQGAVTVGDTRWSAQSDDGSDFVAGMRVEIVAADGIVLRVKRS